MWLEKSEQIIKTIKKYKIIKVSNLEAELQIPRTSLLRYLVRLENEGKIIKSFGEVKIRGSADETNSFARIHSHKEDKINIAKKSKAQIKEGDIIFLDGGSTTYYLAKELKNLKITIYTNNLLLTNIIKTSFMPEVFFISGKATKTTHVVASASSIVDINNINFDKVFLGFNSLHKMVFATTNIEEATLKKVLIQKYNKQQIYLIGRTSKFQEQAKYSFANKKEISLITERG